MNRHDQPGTPLVGQLSALSQKVRELRGGRGLNEETTKQALILPLLQLLGWDTSDPDQVVYEYRRRSKDSPVDFALMLQRAPCLFLEAKSLGHDITDRRWTNQILAYATQSGVGWLVLTNGDDYHIYNAHAPVPLEGKLFRKLSLSQTPVDELAADLSLLMRSDFAGRRIDRVWDAHHTDTQVHALLIKALHEDPDKLLTLLARMSEGKITKSALKASLLRADIRITFPAAPVVRLSNPAEPEEVTARKPSKPKREPVDRQAGKRNTGNPAARTQDLAELFARGILKPDTTLVAVYRGKNLTAIITKEGQIAFGGQTYDSPSAAGSAAYQSVSPRKGDKAPSVNGWDFWKVKHPKTGDVVQLGVLRGPM
jgi:predicted type IV restriction endonuclease